MDEKNLNYLYHQGIIGEIDFHFARFITSLCPSYDPGVFLGAALASRATASGHVYLDLPSTAEAPLTENPGDAQVPKCPPLGAWTTKLYASPVVGSPGQFRPLILDNKNRLYLYRYWDYEKRLSASVLERVQEDIDPINATQLKDSVKRLFPPHSNNSVDWQQVAALIPVFKKFCVISGGPGTGKTFTVAKILALLNEQGDGERLEVFLAAPTGKAAARLSDSIRTAKKTLNCHQDIIDAIPSESYTIHRLLRTIPGSPYFYYNAENQLPADIVVVDEASMVDLALMSKLVAAIPTHARLILIGDKDQLASVEAGSVLGDICDRNRVHGFTKRFQKRFEEITGQSLRDSVAPHEVGSGLQDCIVVFTKSFRFSDSSDIGRLSRSVNRGKVDRAMDLLKTPRSTIRWQDMQDRKDVLQALAKQVIKGYAGYLSATDPREAIEQFGRFKVLCAVNIGPLGVTAVNRLAEQVLTREGLITTDQEWYPGRPVLITRNDYQLGLFNGDIGITMRPHDSDTKELWVYFAGGPGEFRRFMPHKLPEHETVFAMTVHKSQGSEFDEVLLVLPEKDYPVLTRELFYTAITRARHSISIWGSEIIVEAAIRRRIERTSGLRDALWES